jgi:hypothetical protein
LAAKVEQNEDLKWNFQLPLQKGKMLLLQDFDQLGVTNAHCLNRRV